MLLALQIGFGIWIGFMLILCFELILQFIERFKRAFLVYLVIPVIIVAIFTVFNGSWY